MPKDVQLEDQKEGGGSLARHRARAGRAVLASRAGEGLTGWHGSKCSRTSVGASSHRVPLPGTRCAPYRDSLQKPHCGRQGPARVLSQSRSRFFG